MKIKMRIPIEIEIPEEIINQIIEETRQTMAEDVCRYIDEMKSDFKKRETREAEFTIFGLNLAEKKLEAYR